MADAIDLDAIEKAYAEAKATKGFHNRNMAILNLALTSLDPLLAEVRRLRKELGWYADPENYGPKSEYPEDRYAPGTGGRFVWTYDQGERARQALELPEPDWEAMPFEETD